jgi:hypothetical protein
MTEIQFFWAIVLASEQGKICMKEKLNLLSQL